MEGDALGSYCSVGLVEGWLVARRGFKFLGQVSPPRCFEFPTLEETFNFEAKTGTQKSNNFDESRGKKLFFLRELSLFPFSGADFK